MCPSVKLQDATSFYQMHSPPADQNRLARCQALAKPGVERMMIALSCNTRLHTNVFSCPLKIHHNGKFCLQRQRGPPDMEASSFPASRCSSTCAACIALPCSHSAMSATFSSLQVQFCSLMSILLQGQAKRACLQVGLCLLHHGSWPGCRLVFRPDHSKGLCPQASWASRIQHCTCQHVPT